jgi:group II intron reverse transcriptase/maturase
MTSGPTSTKLKEVAERAKRDPHGRFFSLAHLINKDALRRAHKALRPSAAVGVDGVSKEAYGMNLEENLEGLHDRLRTGRYRHQPILRKHIPKEGSPAETRPIGISSTEDKIVQGALREVLQTVYEQDFLPCSYGFRPKRSAHDAIRQLNVLLKPGASGEKWVLELDIKAYFDSLDRTKLLEMLQVRVPDGSMKRLVGKCLKVGILDGEDFAWTESGTVQGSVLSPLLGNIYLHYVLDLWFEKVVKPRLHGRAAIVRYADDAVIVFDRHVDAVRVMKALQGRMAKFGLTLHPEKTRLVNFGRPIGPRQPGTFDFLGFTFHWGRAEQKQRWAVKVQTRRASLKRFMKRITELCRRHRHQPVRVQHASLVRRINGHIQYFGVNGNIRSLDVVVYHATRTWKKWLCRRSQRSRLTWVRFKDLLRDFPLPRSRICVRIWE